MKIFTSHESTILSCGIMRERRAGVEYKYIASWARDGFVELHQVDWKDCRHLQCLQRLQLGKEASFCKWAMDETPEGNSVLYLPHSNEKEVLRVTLRDEKLEISDVFSLRSRGNGDDSDGEDDDSDNDTEDGTILRKKAKGMLMSIAVNSRYLCIGWESGLITVLDKEHPEKGLLFQFRTQEKDPQAFPQPITEIHTFRDEYLAVGSSSSIVNIYRLQDQKLVKQYDLPHKAGINHFANDGERFLVAAGWDHRIRIYDMKRHKLLGALKFHTDTVNCVSVLCGSLDVDETEGESSTHETKRRLVICSGGSDRRIAVWDVNFEAKKA